VAARKNALLGVPQTADPHIEDHPGLWVPAGVSIREIAKAGKLTGVGELLDGNYVAILAKKLGYDAEFSVASGDFYVNKLRSVVDQGRPAVVSMDCENGYPVQLGGAHGHWVLVVGYIESMAG